MQNKIALTKKHLAVRGLPGRCPWHEAMTEAFAPLKVTVCDTHTLAYCYEEDGEVKWKYEVRHGKDLTRSFQRVRNGAIVAPEVFYVQVKEL